MNLDFSESQDAIADLARRIFEGSSEQSVWAEIAKAGLLGIGIGDEFGGIGGGMLELASMLEEFGKHITPVPLLWHTVAGMTIASFGSMQQRQEWLPKIVSGEAVFTVGFGSSLEESINAVPYAQTASRVVISTDAQMFIVDPKHPTVTVEPQTGTSEEPQARLTLASTPAEPLGPASALREIALVAMCAVQTGIADHALHLTADHLKVREQFGRPLGTFQAVQQRIADAYIDVEAMRWTMWQAAWCLDEELPANEEVAIAKYWAAEGGHRVLAAAQHLHGGLGVDVGYPLHRYTTVAKQIEMTLGSAPQQLATLGDLIAEAP